MTCGCGCGALLEVRTYWLARKRQTLRYVHGHNTKVRPVLPKTREKLRQFALRQFSSLKERAALSRRIKRVWQNPDNRARYVKATRAACGTVEFREGQSKSKSENWANPDYRKRQVAAMRNAWKDPERRARRSVLRRNLCRDPARRQQMRQEMIRRWSLPEFVAKFKKTINARPNFAERRLEVLLNQYFHGQFNYVGNRALWIGRKNPDFVHAVFPLVIEMCGEKVHSRPEMALRRKYFSRRGFRLVVVWYGNLRKPEAIKARILSALSKQSRRHDFTEGEDTHVEMADAERFHEKWRDRPDVLARHPKMSAVQYAVSKAEWKEAIPR